MDLQEFRTTLKEEIASSVSHGLGLLFGIVAIPVLTALAAKSGSVSDIIGTSVYGFGFLMVYATSTVYHGVTHPKVKRVMNVLDHISIFLLIAGSYTPFILAYYFNAMGITMLCLVWGFAFAGIIFKIIFSVRFQMLSTAAYVAMGWLVVFFAKSFFASLPFPCFVLLAVGGIFYTAGVLFYLWEKLDYNHAIWHAFVLLGSLCHYVAVLLTVAS